MMGVACVDSALGPAVCKLAAPIKVGVIPPAAPATAALIPLLRHERLTTIGTLSCKRHQKRDTNYAGMLEQLP